MFGQVEIDSIIFNKSSKSLSAVINLTELYEKGNEIEQLSILGIIVPRDNRHCTLRLKHVGRWRVVKNDGILHVSSDLGHVLREHSVDVGAVLSEQSHSTIPIWVHKIHQRVCVLTQTCSKNDQFKVLRHSFQKIVHTRSLRNKDVAHVTFNVDRDGVIRTLNLVELRMN